MTEAKAKKLRDIVEAVRATGAKPPILRETCPEKLREIVMKIVMRNEARTYSIVGDEDE